MIFRRILVFLLFIFLSSCCLFISGKFVYNWEEKDKKQFEHFIDHKNLADKLIFKLFVPKKYYYQYEIKEYNFVILNTSETDTFIIRKPFRKSMVMKDSSDRRVEDHIFRATKSSIRIVDKCGRKVVKVRTPKLLLLPGDSLSLKYDFVVNQFGKPSERDFFLKKDYIPKEFEINVLHDFQYYGILPKILDEGTYSFEIEYEHFEFNEKNQPFYRKIDIKPGTFRIVHDDMALNLEFKNFVDICNQYGKIKKVDLIEAIHKYLANYPNSVYNTNFKRLIEYLSTHKYLLITKACKRR